MTQQDRKPGAPSIVWFRDDLRLADNPALHAATDRGEKLLCIFVIEEDDGLRPHGSASRWWLHHSLASLAADLGKAGAKLNILHGEAAKLLPALVEAAAARRLYFNRRYEGAAKALDETIEQTVTRSGCAVETFNGRLLHEPWEIKTKQGGSYGVFTPYWKAALAAMDPGEPLPRPRKIEGAPYPASAPARTKLEDLGLLPTTPDWAGGLAETWCPGEAGAADNLKCFLSDSLEDYEIERNNLASAGTSRLSPHLRFGEISPRTILAEVRAVKSRETAAGARTFLSELGWREFDYHVLHAHPNLAETNLHQKFDGMPWGQPDKVDLQAWQHGRTGFPVVDAGMRELWATGYMHNRVRMITASFLIKDMMCDWRIGEKWFWDCLCDADPANNTMNWQWVAGCGADAAPYFRIFNPVTQGQKFDPDGDYVRRWVPELAKLDGRAIHAPWDIDEKALEAAGIVLGSTYPRQILNHASARARALKAYDRIKT